MRDSKSWWSKSKRLMNHTVRSWCMTQELEAHHFVVQGFPLGLYYGAVRFLTNHLIIAVVEHRLARL